MMFKKIFFFLFIVNVAKAQVSVFAKVDHLVPDGVDTQGGISLTVSGSTAPYTYVWNPGSITTKDITNVGLGQYDVQVTSASSQIYSNVYDLGYKVLWTNHNRCFSRNDSLISQAPNTNFYGYSDSKNTLQANTDGWVEYVVDNVTNTSSYFIGFVDSIAPNSATYTDIDYGIYYTTTKMLYYYEGGTNYAVIKSAPKVGDVVKVERVGNTINYKINNAVVRTVTVSGISQKTLKLKAVFRSSPAQILNAGCSFSNLSNASFKNYVEVLPIIKHCSSLGISDGSIKASPKIPFANTYLWQPGGTTSQTKSSLSFGTDTLTISDSLSYSSTYKYNVGYKVCWTNTDRCYFRNDSLVNPTNNSTQYGSAVSKNTLDANTDGWFEYVIDNLSPNNYYIGFSDNFSGLQYSVGDIDYGIYYNGSSKYLLYYESGPGDDLYFSIRVGDIVRIERVGNTINYKLNGVVVRTLTVSGLAQKSLKLKAQLLSVNRLVNVGCSFYNKSNSSFNNYVLVNPFIKYNSGIGTNDGSIKLTPKIPFANTYAWQPGGATTSMISSLPVSNYTVIVTDSLGNQSPYNYNIGYKVNWTNTDRCFSRNDTLISTTNNVNIIGTAISKNTLAANTDGWMEYVFSEFYPGEHYIGFLDSIAPLTYAYGDIDFGFNYTNNVIYSYENGTSTLLSRHLKVGDVLRIERVGNTINYKVNNYQLRTLTVSNISQRPLKIKADLFGINRISNVGCSFIKEDSTYFANYVLGIPDITHNSSIGNVEGSIKITPRIPADNTYLWQPGGETTNTKSPVAFGSYGLLLKDNLANKSTFKYNVGYKLNWTGLYNASISGDTLKGNVTGTASAYAKDTLLPGENGWIEYVYSESSSKAFYFGFVDVLSTNQATVNDIDYGYYITTSPILYQAESGSNTIYSYHIRKGDVVRIERVGDTIKYSFNNRVGRTTIAPGVSSKALLVKGVLVNKAKLAKLGASFTHCKFTANAGSPQSITCVDPEVTLNGTTNAPSGSTYLWTPGNETTLSKTTSTPGTYTFKVTNPANGCVAQSLVNVIKPFSASADIDDYENDTTKGQINLSIMGGTPPYNIAWNGNKLPTPTVAYHNLIDSIPGIEIDSVEFKNLIAGLRQKTNYNNLEPGTYPVTIYDELLDSVELVVFVGAKINLGLSNGVSVETPNISPRTINGKTYLYSPGQKIKQTGTLYEGHHGVVVSNVIAFKENNRIEFTVPETTSEISVSLVDRTDEIEIFQSDIRSKAYFQFTGTGIYKLNFLSAEYASGTYNSTDVFKISNDIETSMISFYKNDQLIYERSIWDLYYTDGLLLKISLGSLNASVSNLIFETNPDFFTDKVVGDITNVLCGNSCSGSIDAVGSTVIPGRPVKYELYDSYNHLKNTIVYSSGPNHALFENLCGGKYTIKYHAIITDFNMDGVVPTTTEYPVIVSQTFEVGYLPEWKNLVNSYVSPPFNNLETSGGDAGASTQNILRNSGKTEWFEFGVDGNYTRFSCGLSTTDPNIQWQTINYSFDIYKSGSTAIYYRVMEFGVHQPLLSGSIFGTASLTSKFRIEKNFNVITFKVDNQIVKQFTSIPNSVVDFIGDVTTTAFNSAWNNGYLDKPRMSFGCGYLDQYAVLKKELDGGYYDLISNKLFMKVIGEYAISKLAYKIYDYKNAMLFSNATYPVAIWPSTDVLPGDNRFILDFNSVGLNPGNYVLEVINEKNEKQYLRFKK